MQKEGCEFCNAEFEHTVIKEYENWTAQLFLNQYYPGRCLIKLKRHIVDFFELKESERSELFEEVVPELKDALNNIFEPDLYNYASLGNDCRHLHLHLIPRYRSKRSFEYQDFEDENWNSNFTPYPIDFEIPDQTFERIRTEIRDIVE